MHCAKWLADAHPDLLAFHVANERRGGIGTGVHFKRMGVLSGVADWLVFRGMAGIAIELKDATGKQSTEQKDFEHKWRNCGFSYHVVRTLEQFKAVIDGFLLFR